MFKHKFSFNLLVAHLLLYLKSHSISKSVMVLLYTKLGEKNCLVSWLREHSKELLFLAFLILLLADNKVQLKFNIFEINSSNLT